MPSRTSVFSENITVAPARTSRSAATPRAGLAVTPEKASLPPHCMPSTSSEAGQVSRRRVSKTFRRSSIMPMICSTMPAKPLAESCRRNSQASSSWPAVSSSPGISCSACSFSQPRLMTSAWPPRLGLRARLCRVRIGITASGALMATPQP
ncbi:hypothetical protein D3C80_1482030 [compost metagenome]